MGWKYIAFDFALFQRTLSMSAIRLIYTVIWKVKVQVIIIQENS